MTISLKVDLLRKSNKTSQCTSFWRKLLISYWAASSDVGYLYVYEKQNQLEKALRKCTPHRHLKKFNCWKAYLWYFVPKYFCLIAKFGEDILNHSRSVGTGTFHYGGFDRELWPWKLIVALSADFEHPCQVSWKSASYFSRNITSAAMLKNERTN